MREPQPDDDSSAATGSRFRPDVQGLRAVAVAVVVAFHTGAALTGGFVGVDVFFVISGFVIVGALQAEHRRSATVAVGRFYLRRIRRLLPALALLLVVVAVLAPWLGPRNDVTTERMVTGGALFGANVQLLRLAQGYFEPSAEANPLLHLWTLSLEEQVYVVVPALVLGLGVLARWRGWRWGRTVAAALAVAGAASFGLALVFAGGITDRFGNRAEQAFYLAPTRVWEFLAGALLALGAARVERLGPVVREVAGVAGAGLLVWSVVVMDGGTQFPQVAALVPVVAALLLLVAGTGEGSAVGRVLSTRALGWVGDRSYSWYLWHWPVIVFARATFPGTTWAPVAAGVASIVPAALAYRFVEDPIRRRRPAATRPTLVLGAACVAVPLLVAQTIEPVGERLDRDPAVVELGADNRGHLDLERRCNDALDQPQGPDVCTWPVPGGRSTGRAVLLGDSNAGHLSEGFIAAAHAEGLDATIQTRAACPFADLYLRRSGLDDTACRDWFDAQRRWVLAERPDVLVVAHAGDLLMDKAEVDLALEVDGGYRSDDGAQETIWADGVERALAPVVDAGIPVVLVAPVTRFTGWPGLGGCARLRVRTDVSGCGARRDPTERPVDRAEAAVRTALPAVVGLDLTPTLCPDGTCRTRRDGTWVWKDESHLSVAGSEMVAPDLRSAMAEARR